MTRAPVESGCETARVFVALMLPTQIAPELELMQKRLLAVGCSIGAQLRATPSHQFHLTLAFLGEIPKTRVPLVIAGVCEFTRVVREPFRLGADGFVVFPSARRPRVIGLALADGSGELTRAVNRLHDHLRSHDFALESREFRPHVTLVRLQQPARCDWSVAYHQIAAQECTTVVVFQSRLGAGGARYEVLHQTTL